MLDDLADELSDEEHLVDTASSRYRESVLNTLFVTERFAHRNAPLEMGSPYRRPGLHTRVTPTVADMLSGEARARAKAQRGRPPTPAKEPERSSSPEAVEDHATVAEELSEEPPAGVGTRKRTERQFHFMSRRRWRTGEPLPPSTSRGEAYGLLAERHALFGARGHRLGGELLEGIDEPPQPLSEYDAAQQTSRLDCGYDPHALQAGGIAHPRGRCPSRFFQYGALLRSVATGELRPLRGSYVLSLWREGRRLPPRELLPPSAVWSAAELRTLHHDCRAAYGTADGDATFGLLLVAFSITGRRRADDYNPHGVDVGDGLGRMTEAYLRNGAPPRIYAKLRRQVERADFALFWGARMHAYMFHVVHATYTYSGHRLHELAARDIHARECRWLHMATWTACTPARACGHVHMHSYALPPRP